MSPPPRIIDGKSLTEWAELLGVPRKTLADRLRRMSPERALQPGRMGRSDAIYVEHNGQTKSADAWAKQLGIAPVSLRRRLRNGWTPAKAVTTPPGKR